MYLKTGKVSQSSVFPTLVLKQPRTIAQVAYHISVVLIPNFFLSIYTDNMAHKCSEAKGATKVCKV